MCTLANNFKWAHISVTQLSFQFMVLYHKEWATLVAELSLSWTTTKMDDRNVELLTWCFDQNAIITDNVVKIASECLELLAQNDPEINATMYIGALNSVYGNKIVYLEDIFPDQYDGTWDDKTGHCITEFFCRIANDATHRAVTVTENSFKSIFHSRVRNSYLNLMRDL